MSEEKKSHKSTSKSKSNKHEKIDNPGSLQDNSIDSRSADSKSTDSKPVETQRPVERPIERPVDRVDIKQPTLAELRQYQNLELFSFEGLKTNAFCSKVLDCETVHLVFNWRDVPIKWLCKCHGYKISNIKESDLPEAKHYLKDLIEDKKVKVEFGPFDKFGRIQVYIKKDDTTVNQLMINKFISKK